MNRWDVVLLAYPFSDLQAEKVRPAVVISPNAYNQSGQDELFMLITSNTARQSPHEIIVPTTHTEFKRTGLRVESAIRVPKITTLSKTLVKKTIGSLGPRLIAEVERELRNFLQLVPYQPGLTGENQNPVS